MFCAVTLSPTSLPTPVPAAARASGQLSTPAIGRRRLSEEAPVHLLLLLLARTTLNHGATLTVGHSSECRDVMA